MRFKLTDGRGNFLSNKSVCVDELSFKDGSFIKKLLAKLRKLDEKRFGNLITGSWNNCGYSKAPITALLYSDMNRACDFILTEIPSSARNKAIAISKERQSAYWSASVIDGYGSYTYSYTTSASSTITFTHRITTAI